MPELVREKDVWREEELECSVSLAMETKGNARFFKNQMECKGEHTKTLEIHVLGVIKASGKSSTFLAYFHSMKGSAKHMRVMY